MENGFRIFLPAMPNVNDARCLVQFSQFFTFFSATDRPGLLAKLGSQGDYVGRQLPGYDPGLMVMISVDFGSPRPLGGWQGNRWGVGFAGDDKRG